jgi:hypothetical protein
MHNADARIEGVRHFANFKTNFTGSLKRIQRETPEFGFSGKDNGGPAGFRAAIFHSIDGFQKAFVSRRRRSASSTPFSAHSG